MWKKDEAPSQPSTHSSAHPAPDAVERAPRMPRSSTPEVAVVGRKIRLKGEVTGEEDLVIEGHVEGSINLGSQAVTVGPDGQVNASIVGRTITVEGRIEGNVVAEEQIILRSSAKVEGDLMAPRVTMEDGAVYRGSIDMGDVATRPGAGGVRNPREPRTKEVQFQKAAASSIPAKSPTE